MDAQDIPKSLARVIKLKEAVKNKTLPVSKRKKTKNKGIKLIRVGSSKFKPTHRKGRPEKVVPVFNQRPGESEYEFLERVNRETHNFVKETEFETKFNVEIKRSSETGDIEEIVKRKKDEIEELEKLARKHKNISPKKLKKKLSKVKLSKSQKKKEKLLKKKEAKDEDVDEFKKFTDKVEFGEVVHAPPELKIRPKNASVDKIKVIFASFKISIIFNIQIL